MGEVLADAASSARRPRSARVSHLGRLAVVGEIAVDASGRDPSPSPRGRGGGDAVARVGGDRSRRCGMRGWRPGNGAASSAPATAPRRARCLQPGEVGRHVEPGARASTPTRARSCRTSSAVVRVAIGDRGDVLPKKSGKSVRSSGAGVEDDRAMRDDALHAGHRRRRDAHQMAAAAGRRRRSRSGARGGCRRAWRAAQREIGCGDQARTRRGRCSSAELPSSRSRRHVRRARLICSCGVELQHRLGRSATDGRRRRRRAAGSICAFSSASWNRTERGLSASSASRSIDACGGRR